MTKPLDHSDVSINARRLGPPRLTAPERQALDKVEDPQLRKVIGETLLQSRSVQANFDEIREWFPVQPQDVADSIREGDEIEGIEDGAVQFPPASEPDWFEHLIGGFDIGTGVSSGNEGGWIDIEEFEEDDLNRFSEEGNILRIDIWAEHTVGFGGGGEVGDGEDKNFVFNQGPAAEVWVINHELHKIPAVIVFDDEENEMEGQVVPLSDDEIEIRFTAEVSGKAVLN